MTSYTTPQKNALKERAAYCLAVCSEPLAKGGRTNFLEDMCSVREGGGARKKWDVSGSNNFEKKIIFLLFDP